LAKKWILDIGRYWMLDAGIGKGIFIEIDGN
jgi:hypothetical protein